MRGKGLTYSSRGVRFMTAILKTKNPQPENHLVGDNNFEAILLS
jgi:hypothetical protein